MGSFELFDHTADLGLVGRGEDLGEALAWLASGMFSVVANLEAVEPRETIRVSVNATDREALAVDWLNELLFRYEADGFLPKEFHVAIDAGETGLDADCVGEPADPQRHRLRSVVKAATYHGLQISHDGEWRIQVILDI